MVVEQNLGLVGSRLTEQPIDRGEDLPGLLADALAFRLIGDLACEIDGRVWITACDIRGPACNLVMVIVDAPAG